MDFRKESIKKEWNDFSNIPLLYKERTILKPTKKDLELFTVLSKVETTGGIVPLVNNGTNLYIWGKSPGVGKTSWATRLAISYLNRCKAKLDKTGVYGGIPVVFITVNDYLMREKESFDDTLEGKKEFDRLKKSILSCDLLVMDDLCFSERKYSDWENNSLYRIIEERLSNKKSIIYTSNRSKAEMKTLIERKVWDRIFSKSTKILHIQDNTSRR